MQNMLARLSNSMKVIIAVISLVLIVFGSLSVRYRRYAYAVRWHCVHGNYVEIDGYRAKLPLLWWESGPDTHGRTLLSRAYASSGHSAPVIHIDPAGPGEVANSEQEELELTESSVRVLSHNAQEGWTHSLLVLKPKQFDFYCTKIDESLFGMAFDTTLVCHAAKLKYSFTYQGSSALEKEAETLLSSVEPVS